MARKEHTVITITDDLTGDVVPEGEAVNVRFAYDGTEYEIDLGPESAAEFAADLERWINAGREYRHKAAGATRSGKKGRSDNKLVREWAKANGHKVGDIGKIPGSVYAAYDAANGKS